jgi:hypothetical protein
MSDAAAGRAMIDIFGDYQPLTRSLWFAVGAVLTNLVSLSQLWFGDAGFEVGDAAVGEAVVLSDGGQFVGEASDRFPDRARCV